MEKQEYSLKQSRALHTSWPEMFGAEFHVREMKRTASLVPFKTPLLDVGCGSGLISHFLPSTIEYVGVDFNPDYLTGWKGRTGTSTIQGNILRLPFPDKSFATVILLHVIEHLPASLQPILAREIHRVLSPGGMFVMSTPNSGTLINADKFLPPHNPKHYHCIYEKEAADLLTLTGYGNIRRHGFDIIIEFPSPMFRILPEKLRRQIAGHFAPLEKHLLFTAQKP